MIFSPADLGSVARMYTEGFPRKHRLRKRRDFLRVYGNGRRRAGRFVVVFALRDNPGEPWRLGLTTPKRTAHAVGRNRLRRLVREFFRRRYARAGGWDMVVNLRASARRISAALLWRDLEKTLDRLGLPLRPERGRTDSDRPR